MPPKALTFKSAMAALPAEHRFSSMETVSAPARARRPGQAPLTPSGPSTTSLPPRQSGQAPLTPGSVGSKRAGGGSALAPAAYDWTGEANDSEHMGGDGAPMAPKKPPPLKSLIESYFSDDGLRHDRHLHELIDQSPGGWIDVDEVLGLKKVQALRVRREDVLRALKSSTVLETWRDPDGSSAAVRRPVNRPLPKLATGPPPREQAKPRAAGRENPNEAEQEAGVEADLLGEDQEPTSVRSAPGGALLFPGRLDGIVSDYDEESGTAAISCSEVEALFKRPVAIDWRELEKAGAAVNIGSLVSFLVELGPDGGPRARDLKLRAADDDEEEEVRPGKKRRVASAVVGERYIGSIKSFHEVVGVGFIACKATHGTFGRDVAIDATEFASFAVGDYVSFELSIDEDVGTPKGVELEAASAEEEAAPKTSSAKKPKAKAKPAAQVRNNGRRYTGRVKSFNEDLGMGRIECTSARLGKLTAVSAEEITGFVVGDTVSFVLADDPTFGTPMAVELEAA